MKTIKLTQKRPARVTDEELVEQIRAALGDKTAALVKNRMDLREEHDRDVAVLEEEMESLKGRYDTLKAEYMDVLTQLHDLRAGE